MAGPGDSGRGARDREGISGLADGYRKAAPYLAASTSLVIAVAAFLGLGYWLDKRLGNEVPWLTMVGALVGMTGGFISFFKTVMGTRNKRP